MATTLKLNDLRYIKHSGPLQLNDILVECDGSVRVGHDLPDIVNDIKSIHPGGVNMIIIGASKAAGWGTFTSGQPNGIIAILIGLLLPAVQKVREAAHRSSNQYVPSLSSLKFALAAGGEILIVGDDGKLLPYV